MVLVADSPAPEIAKLRSVVPPPALVRVSGRAGAKLLVCLVLARRERPHWTLGFNLVPHGITAMLVARLTRGKSLFYMIGGPVEIDGGGWRSDNAVLQRLPRPVPLLERLLLRIVRACTAVAVMGQGARSLLIERGVAPNRVIAIPASVDEQRFHPRTDASVDYDLVTASQLIPRKRLEDLLRAFAALRAGRPHLRAAIVGSGPLELDLRMLAAQLGIAEAVDFLGFRRDVEDILARARVFVLTSAIEGLPIAITEAMASGLPVVVTDVGEVRDLVRDGENGYLVRVGDVDGLVDRVAKLLDDPALRRELAAAAAVDSVAFCGRERVAGLFASLFADIR